MHQSAGIDPALRPRQPIGSVRDYSYLALQPLFDADQLWREGSGDAP